MELQLILIVARLIDIGAVNIDSINRIVVIEQGEGIQEKESLFETVWKMYHHQPDKKEWISKKMVAAYLPRLSEISLTGNGCNMFAVMQSNFDDALYNSSLSPTKNEAVSPYTIEKPLHINLTIPSGMKVKIPHNGDWSTPFLSTRRCLFNPSILILNSTETLIAANTADAAAWIFSVKKQGIEEQFVTKKCLEPRLLDVAGTRLLLFRQCPEEWPLYYKRPSTRMAAELLPLMMHILDKDSNVKETKCDISNGWMTGPSFVFDACVNNRGDCVLATVTGLVTRPVLQLLISRDKGATWDERISTPLKDVPYRLRISVSDTRILTACTFKKHDGFHVMAAEIPLN